jgi:hypothetical protein
MMRSFFVLSLVLAISSAKFYVEDDEVLNDRPIVGVFAYPSEFYGTFPGDEFNYVAAGYVKWIE